MRQVRPRATASKKQARAGGRAKPPPRAPEARPEPRVQRKTERDESPQGVLGRLQRSVFVRYPIFILTMTLVVGSIGAGLLYEGYITAGYGAAKAGIAGAFANAGFSVRNIALSGNERTKPADVYAVLGIAKGDAIFGADPAQARSRLKSLPWVADADVRRQYPDGVSITLIEKRPFALWKSGKDLAVVERSGAVITTQGANAFTRLPLLLGVGAPQAAAPFVDALVPYKAINARLKAADRIGERRWDLILSGGVTVKLPEDGWEAQLKELERLIVEKGVLERDIEMIDLRYPDSFIFRLHNGDSRPVPRDKHA